jgi:hypothetical protein
MRIQIEAKDVWAGAERIESSDPTVVVDRADKDEISIHVRTNQDGGDAAFSIYLDDAAAGALVGLLADTIGGS